MRWWTRAGAACVGALALSFLLMAPAPGRAGTPTWLRARTAHFTLYCSADSTAILRTAHELERMAEVIGLWGLGSPSALRSTVVLIGLPDGKRFEPHQPTIAGKRQEVSGYVTESPAGFWIGYREDEASGRQVAHHEYAHTLVAERYQSVPLCLNEGLAEFLSTFASTESECLMGGDIPGHRYQLQRGAPYPLDELFAVTPDSPIYRESSERTQRFYGESWALVHYLMQKSVGGSMKLHRLLDAIADGAPARAAFAATYPQEDWTSLPERLRAYTGEGALKEQRILFTRARAELGIELQAVPAVDVTLHLGLWRAMNASVPLAGTVTLLQEAQAQPALAPLAAAGLGLMDWQAENLDAALPRFRAAAAAGSADPLALAIAGLGMLQIAASREGAAQDSLVLEANRILSRSVVLDPSHAPAQRGLAECASFLRALAEATQARAQPQDDPATRKATIKYNTGVVAMNGGDYARAREAFTIVSESAPDSSLRAMARARLAEIADAEDFDRGVAAANAQDFKGALRIFERLAEQALNPDLRLEARANARRLRAILGGTATD